MDPAQIEQMRQLAAGGAGAAPPSERDDPPEVMTALATTLVEGDAVLAIAEVVARAREDATHLKLQCAQVSATEPPPPTDVADERPADGLAH